MITPALIVSSLLAGSVATASVQPSAETPDSINPGMTAMTVDAELRTGLVRVLSIDGMGVVAEDRRGRERVFRDGELLALIRVDATTDVSVGIGAVSLRGAQDMALGQLLERTEASSTGVLVTTDGSRFPGTLEQLIGGSSIDSSDEGVPEDPDAVVWVTEFATRVFAIENVSRVVMGHAPASVRLTLPAAVATDTMMLANGDALEGFVAALGREAVLELDDGAEVRLPPDRVNAVVFANPDVRSQGVRVWFDDGEVSAGDAVRTNDGRWIGIEQGPPGTGDGVYRSLENVRTLVFDAGRLLALSDLEGVGTGREGAETTQLRTHPDDLLLEEAPALGALDIVLPGPMRVTYDLPAGVSRFACTVALAHPESSWSDCTLTVRADGEVLGAFGLDAETPVRAINLDLDGARTLEFELDEGAFGPVLDRVLLRRPLLLLSE